MFDIVAFCLLLGEKWYVIANLFFMNLVLVYLTLIYLGKRVIILTKVHVNSMACKRG